MSDEEIRKAAVMSVVSPPVAGDGGTSQPFDDDPWTPEGAIMPPEDLGRLAALTQVGRIRRSCIAAIAHNTVGLGFDLGVREGHEDEVEDITEAKREARAELDRLARRDTMLKRPSFGRLLTTVIWDKYECGNGYLEVARNKITGKVSGLYHAPGKRIRRNAERDGWIMLRNEGILTDAVRFYDFGSKVKYDADGMPTGKLAKPGMRWDRNELIPFQLYTSESRDYGLPPDAQLAVDYLGDKLAGDTNASFFGSSGVPPTVIFVQGEEKDDGSNIRIEVPPAFTKMVADALRGGHDSRSRVAIIGVPAGFKAQVENLAVTSERDMGFIAFRADNRRATLGAFRMSPVFVADIEDAGKYTAEVERALTKEQVFDPEQQEIEETLGGGLVAELFPHLELDFEELAIKGDEANRESANDLADRGRITNAEYRAAHGYLPMPEAADGTDPEPGEVPFGWNSELVPAQKIGGQQGTPEAPSALQKASLEETIVEEIDEAVSEAIHRIHEIAPGTVPQALVVEKIAGEVRIREMNGTGG